jgi:pyrroloquinoline quinone biosynthesis protein B
MRFFLLFILIIGFTFSADSPYVVVLGIAQDGGSPHAGCEKICCKDLWINGEKEKVSCIGIVDPKSGKSWLIDATPDFSEQYRIITKENHTELAGIFLTHAHMGHYTGLLHLGREVMGAKDIPVFAMPKMKEFLESNSPWNQLVSLENIEIQLMKNDKEIKLADGLFIEPFLVPHRDEYSETIGYKIMGTNHSVLFIPDIDKW